jgi:hypothetical protein
MITDGSSAGHVDLPTEPAEEHSRRLRMNGPYDAAAVKARSGRAANRAQLGGKPALATLNSEIGPAEGYARAVARNQSRPANEAGTRA